MSQQNFWNQEGAGQATQQGTGSGLGLIQPALVTTIMLTFRASRGKAYASATQYCN
jgi:hypothetical protein